MVANFKKVIQIIPFANLTCMKSIDARDDFNDGRSPTLISHLEVDEHFSWLFEGREFIIETILKSVEEELLT